MATAVITPNFNVLSDCETNTGWTGCTVPDSDLKKQGSFSASGILKSVGINLGYFSPVAPVNLTGTHIRMWVNFAFPSYLDTTVNGGIAIYIFDGTNVGLWNILGSDNYPGGWKLITIDTTIPLDSGEGLVDLTNITRVGLSINLLASPRNVTTTWIDYLVYGDSVVVTGGTDIDPITWNDIGITNLAGGYGAITDINGVLFVNTAIIIGDTTNDTYLEDNNAIIVFEDQLVADDLYKIEGIAGAVNVTSIVMSNCVIKAANDLKRYLLNFEDVNLDVLEFNSTTFINASNSFFKVGQILDGNNFVACMQILTQGASISGGMITKSTDPLGSLHCPNDGGSTIHDLTFIDNLVGIEIDHNTEHTYVGMIFMNNGVDINNTSGLTLIINNTAGSNASTYMGSLVEFINAILLELTDLIDGSEVKVFQGVPGLASTLIGGTEEVVNNTFSMSHSVPGQVGYIMIDNIEYISIKIPLTFSSTDSSFPVSQQYDRVANNPD